MGKKRMDTRAVGLDVGLGLMRWLTGSENLHYGDWTGLPVTAGNLGAAQAAYTDRLFRHLPPAPARILDIGGGAGETARKLIALGHRVEIVIPSAYLAARCRANAPEAIVHECRFEDFVADGLFDVCLFSESYQYIPLAIGLGRALALVAPGGRVVVADCFRRPGWYRGDVATVGGGHGVESFRKLLDSLPVRLVAEEDITEAVAPSVDIEQGLFNVIGLAVTRTDQEMALRRPLLRRIVHLVLRLAMGRRRWDRLDARLNRQDRNAAAFAQNNIYLMLWIEPADAS